MIAMTQPIKNCVKNPEVIFSQGLYVESTPAGSSSINALPEAKNVNVEVTSKESLRFIESLPEEIRWMSEYAPVFQVNGDDIEIFQDLNTFRKILLVRENT